MLNLPRELVVGGPLTRQNHAAAVKLAEPRSFVLVQNLASVVRGRVQFGRPMMALVTEKKLGPVRHAVAQMVVAGTMVVQPPVQVRVSDGPRKQVLDSDGSRSHPARTDEHVDLLG